MCYDTLAMSEQRPEDNDKLLGFIASTVEMLRDQMATKSDLAAMATKSDLAAVEARLAAKIEAETTAIRGDIEQVHVRLDSIERSLSTRLNQLEAEMSRMRSVLYLLVKDKPDILRLLGQSPFSDEGRAS